MPALGFSLFLVAIGAILAFAVRTAVSGISIQTIGVILMVVGIIGMAMSMMFWTTWAPFARRDIDSDYRDTDTDIHVHHTP